MARSGLILPLVAVILTTLSPSLHAVDVPPTATCLSGQADVVFVIDSSGSVGSANFQRILQFVQNVSMALPVAPNKVQIGAVRFSSSPAIQFHLKNFTNSLSVYMAVGNIVYNGGGTYTDEALQVMRTESFATINGGRNLTGIPQIGVVVTDGQSAYTSRTRDEAMKAKAAGIIMVSVGIGSGVNMQELRDIASNSSTTEYVFHINDFQNMYQSQGAIVAIACAVASGVTCLTGTCNTGTSVQAETLAFLSICCLCEVVRRWLLR